MPEESDKGIMSESEEGPDDDDESPEMKAMKAADMIIGDSSEHVGLKASYN